MTSDDVLLFQELSRDEGRKPVAYTDTVGHKTCGIGHNMDAKPLAAGVKFPLDDNDIDQIYADDMEVVFEGLDKDFPWWRDMTYARQRVVANMCFNMGLHNLEEFHNTMAAMKDKRYEEAAKGMLDSKWAKQVGHRADLLADMMIEG